MMQFITLLLQQYMSYPFQWTPQQAQRQILCLLLEMVDVAAQGGMGGRGKVIARAQLISNSICFLMAQFRAATDRSLENHHQLIFFPLFLFLYPVCGRLALQFHTVTCSPFHEGRWCVRQSLLLHKQYSRCSATGAREELQLQKHCSCYSKCPQRTSKLVRFTLLGQILSLHFSWRTGKSGDSPDCSISPQ